MEERITGRAFRCGDDVNTDVIIPGRFLTIVDPDELGGHAFEGMGEEYPARLRERQLVVAGRNFGCGSSREQAATAIKHAGIRVVVAKSFSRLFYRNALNLGLPIVECPEAPDRIAEGDPVTVDFSQGTVEAGGQAYRFPPLPEFLVEMLREGGLVPQLRRIVAERRAARARG
ncbi:MAG: 3-isopropylmalate dehydratase [Deltaproteobacteria bacterium]|nr:3-isopropylmalate dehydratase [Deltaproteobacteria bacterium]MBI3079407.1 3-isopropylmalate dehydratase [Deltaproteobacteria bacterium]